MVSPHVRGQAVCGKTARLPQAVRPPQRPPQVMRAVAPSGAPCVAPLVAGPVRAGFPSPAEDYVEGALDLTRHLIRHPAATFIVRVEGESMTGAGIYPGDLLVVDRSVEPQDGHVVIAQVGGELTVKRLKKGSGGRAGAWRLVAEHPDFPPILLSGDEDGDDEASALWGVVTSAVRMLVK